ncbi:MAG: universal stress protein [Methylobacter sp.]|uniref:universal stress protein n=1 Tax=Methylobacter sp. TaxID=2051955 RepID=UPI00258D8969|nr:universal stress protein [Methylobacter sp.]MCL7420480.1 universal stress protein [Methylobacter sp.]
MGDYQHILLAVDYSGHDDTVIRKARMLAKQYRSRLSIIHVLDDIPMSDTAYGTVIPLDRDSGYDLLEEKKSRLVQIADKLGIEPGDRWLVWGVPHQEIVSIAEREQVDLIVLGSHGRHGLALLLGSTANSVLHDASCDVMAVRLRDDEP